MKSTQTRTFSTTALLVLTLLSMEALGQTSAVSNAASQGFPSFAKVTVGDATTDMANSNGASWLDYDNDGHLDLMVANVGGVNFLYKNNGSGVLVKVTSGPIATDNSTARGVCAADYDNDDDLDIFLSGMLSTLYVNDGSGGFAAADAQSTFGKTDLRGWACTWADYDLDGYVDLFITHPALFVGNPATSNHLFRNKGDGTLEEITGVPPTTGLAPYTVATWSDYDLDGDPDLFIGAGPATGAPGPDFVYHNMMIETGTADLVRVTEGPLATINRDGQVINWVDYDNDGDFDVYVTNWGGANGGGLRDELYENKDGVLSPVIEGIIVTDRRVSLANTWGDFDNDGDLDAYVADGTGGVTSRFYDNNGDGTFSRLIVGPIISDVGVHWGATAGDYDNDGDLDLFAAVATAGSRNVLYRNDLANGNHWLKVRTVGTESNRSGIGAILRAKATINGVPTWMMRDVSAQNSFNGHNELTIHFGLGDATVIDSLLVQWPSGAQDLYENVDADQLIVATEGESPTAVATEDDALPAEGFVLETNYPNPVVDYTNFVFTLPEPETVNLSVHDALGRLVATPVTGLKTSGRHEVRFSTESLPSGVYLYRLDVDGQSFLKTMSVVR